MKTAFEAGVNFFDNAEVYARGQAEIVMGKALKNLVGDVDGYLVSSKVICRSVNNPKPTQWGLIFEACDQTMDRQGVDYLDLY